MRRFKRLIIYFLYLIFWLVYFEIARLLFAIFNTKEFVNFDFIEFIKSFYNGFSLDISVVACIGVLVMPFFIISAFVKKTKFIELSLNIITFILLLVFSVIIIADCETYKYWGYRIDYSVFMYLKTPAEAKASINTWKLILLIFTAIVYAISSFLAYKYIIAKKFKTLNNEKYYSLLYILIMFALIIPIRGGIGVVPLNIGASYYSNNMFYNHIAINVVWNCAASLFSQDVDFKQFDYFEDEVAENYFQESQLSEQDTSMKLLTDTPKHIIFIVLESFTSNAMSVYGADSAITPNLDTWAKRGILFDNFYANGDRSEKGIVSIFSAVSPLPEYSIMKTPKESRKLNSIITKLVDNGYDSRFYYGGDINFANMNSYLKYAGFKKIISKNNLYLNAKTTKWGYHDEYMFDVFYNDIIKLDKPCVSVLYTLSSHEPYNVPNNYFGTNDLDSRAKNSYRYTDSCLNAFLTRFYNSSEWEKSLIILVADHGTRFGDVDMWNLPKFKILMLMTGGLVAQKGFVCSKTADHSDIAATLLAALNIKHDEFIFSEDIFSTKNTNAFYVFQHGFAFIKDDKWLIFDTYPQDIVCYSEGAYYTCNYAKAYCQKVAKYYKSILEK